MRREPEHAARTLRRGAPTMASLSIAFAIRSERFEQARRWGREKMGPRIADQTESNRHVGLSRESWHLQQAPDGGGLLSLSCEGPDLAAAFAPAPRETIGLECWAMTRRSSRANAAPASAAV